MFGTAFNKVRSYQIMEDILQVLFSLTPVLHRQACVTIFIKRLTLLFLRLDKPVILRF